MLLTEFVQGQQNLGHCCGRQAASAYHTDRPNSVNPGKILLFYGSLFDISISQSLPTKLVCYPSQLIIAAVKEILISSGICNLLISFNLTYAIKVCM